MTHDQACAGLSGEPLALTLTESRQVHGGRSAGFDEAALVGEDDGLDAVAEVELSTPTKPSERSSYAGLNESGHADRPDLHANA